MQYKPLKTVFHQLGEGPARDEEQRRRGSAAAITWDYRIGDKAMFCMLTPEIVTMIERIMSADARALKAWGRLPILVQRRMLRRAVIDEIKASNDIENVRSTRQEIENALKNAERHGRSGQRFDTLTRLYLDLLKGQIAPARTLDDIRRTYDAVTNGEIADSQAPDGVRFRAQGVQISTGQRVIHHGAHPESAIEQGLEAMLSQQGNEEIPFLVRAVVAHFMFEHVHPFYDGNGRTGRFLLARELSSLLSPMVWFGLSSSIEAEKNRYYRAFSNAEHVLSRADITPFVATMLQLISGAQGDNLDLLDEVLSRLERVEGALANVPETSEQWSSREREVLRYLAHATIGAHPSDRCDVELGELAELMGMSKQVVRRDMQSLVDREWATFVKRRPVSIALSEKAREALLGQHNTPGLPR